MAPKAKARPLNAAAKAAQERLALVKQQEEERRRLEEEQRKLEEEERKREEEEARKAEEERQRRLEARAEKREQLRKEGKLLSKTEKQRRAKAEAYRAQLEAQGLLPVVTAEEGEKPSGSAVVVEKKKKKKVIEEVKPEVLQEEEKVEEKQEACSPLPADVHIPESPGKKVQAVDDWEDLLASDREEEPKKDEQEKEEKEETAAPQLSLGLQEPASPTSKSVVSIEAMSPKSRRAVKAERKAQEGENIKALKGSPSKSKDEGEGPSFRSPICCIMGHVDTGKTKLLDKIRRTNVQEGEAGGITQQIGASFFPGATLEEQTNKVNRKLEVQVPGLLIIDTPGHESFTNLRTRGSSLCDIAILVIDIMHGLEPQTRESIELLRQRKCPFIIALNKMDRLYQWKSAPYRPIRDSLKAQKGDQKNEFQKRLGEIQLQLSMMGLNTSVYWDCKDTRKELCIVPTSAHTGEGIPDLLFMICKLTQVQMADRITLKDYLQCTVLEVKNIEGLGFTIDVILVNGELREGEQIVVSGLGGPIVTTIRALLTPQPLRDMRVKNEYIHHKKISAAMGIKIAAPGLEDALAGTTVHVCRTEEEVEEAKRAVEKEKEQVISSFNRVPEGVYVMASTLGSLEALLEFLRTSEIPVNQVALGKVNKSDVRRAALMLEKKAEYGVILAFDVEVDREAKAEAEKMGVKIMTAEIIYHLFDQFTKYIEDVRASTRQQLKNDAVFPCILRIGPSYVFNKKDPIVVGVDVEDGILKLGTPIAVPEKGVSLGRVVSIEKDHKAVEKAVKGDSVAIKIQPSADQSHVTYGRHFDCSNQLISEISRKSIECLKQHFKTEMRKEDWKLIIKLKPVFKID